MKKNILLLCLVAGLAAAQEFRATISGRVTDSQNAGIVGVKVTAIQIGTEAKTEAISEVGAVTETINVSSQAPVLDTTSASTGQVISSAQIDNMPVSRRTPLAWAQLAFGVVPNTDPRFTRPFDNAGPSGFSMGGAPAQVNELWLDEQLTIQATCAWPITRPWMQWPK